MKTSPIDWHKMHPGWYTADNSRLQITKDGPIWWLMTPTLGSAFSQHRSLIAAKRRAEQLV